MPKLRELFALDVEKEINLVIKADEQDPAQVEKDISEYIVTDQIEELLETFLEDYTLNSTKNIGVWISGFFGSGKSYFAKILGYLIANTKLGNGLTAHDRFRERLNSSDKKDFIDGKISTLEKIPAEVVIFEIIKDISLSENNTIQRVMLKKLFEKLGYSKDLNVSSMEFELEKQGYYEGFKNYLIQNSLDINNVRDNQATFRKYAVDYLINFQHFSPEDSNDFLKAALRKYSSELNPSSFADICMEISEKEKKRIVFIVDEMGAYVASQRDSDDRLLQLQAISESFSSKGNGRLWLIVTSQEKIDEIAHATKKRSSFSKIVDRFPIRLNLTSENVDEVVRRKMLAKKPTVIDELKKLFETKKGNIQTISDTKGSYPKTDNFDSFKDYYPFFDYQIKLLPDLIESPVGTIYAEANERKLISIVDTVLKNLKDEEHTRCVNLVDIFDSLGVNFFGSGKIKHINSLDEIKGKPTEGSPIKPSDVMKALEIMKRIKQRIKPTEEILSRVLVSDLNQNTYQMQKYVHQCVEMLKDSQQITVYEGIIDVVSDIEKEFIEYMEKSAVPMPDIKKKIVERLETIFTLKNLPYKNGPSIPIKWSYNDGKEWGKNDGIVIKILSFSSDDPFEKRIEDAEFESANHKETVYVVPNSNNVEKKAEELERIEKALKEFQTSKSSADFESVRTKYANIYKEKQRELENEIKDCLGKGMLVYYYESKKVDGKLEDSIREIIDSKVIDTLYPNITSEKAKVEEIRKILTVPKDKLAFVRDDDDHAVFEKSGELIEHHKLINPLAKFLEEKRKGSDVLEKFSKAPYGWTQETIMYALAAMLRGGKIQINGNDDYADFQVISTLTTPAKLKNATISMNASIPIEQKEAAFRLFNEILGKRELELGDPNSKFFQVGEKAIAKLVENAKSVNNSVRSFGADEPFDVDWLGTLEFKLQSGNPKALAIVFSKKDEISKLNSKIVEEKDFLDKNLSSLRKEKDFVDQIIDEIEKIPSIDKEKIEKINNYIQEFKKMIPNLLMHKQEIEETFEKIRNEYKIIFTPFHEEKEGLLNDFRKLLEESSTKKNALGEVAGEQGWFTKYEYEIKEPCAGLEIELSPKCENCKLALYETKLLIPKIESDLKEFKEKLDEFMKKIPNLKSSPTEKKKVIKLKKKMTYGELKKEISNISTEDDTIVEIELEG